MNAKATQMDRDVLLADAQDPARTPFDYVIVGSGAGGGPLAARLAEAGRRVLVIEAGVDPAVASASRSSTTPPDTEPGDLREVFAVPGYHAAATEDPQMSWEFSVRHYADDARQRDDSKYEERKDGSIHGTGPKGGIQYPRAAGLGGCTGHYAMIVIRPNDSDWDEIARRTGDETWRSENMQGYFAKLENCLYYVVFRGYLGQILGGVLRLVQWVATQLNPRGQLDLGGHGTGGWQPTSFIDPLVVAGIARRDRMFLGILFDVLWFALSDKSDRSLIRRALTHFQVLQFLDPNVRSPDFPNRARLALIPIGTDGRRRFGVRERLLDVAARHPDRLVIVTAAHATRVLFEKSDADKLPRATGVEVKHGPNLYRASALCDSSALVSTEARYFARREVILCGGAFNTPQLLMLSGIGDAKHLRQFGIPGLVDRNGDVVASPVNWPGVGENLQDRYEVSVISKTRRDFSTLAGVTFRPGDRDDPAFRQWQRDGTGLYSTNGGALAMLRSSSVNRRSEPDLFLFGFPAAFRGYYWGWSRELLRETKGATITQRNLWTWLLLKAYTDNNRGTVRLTSGDPLDPPEIIFRSFEEGPPGHTADVTALCDGVRAIRAINGHVKAFTDEVQPGPECADGSRELAQWIKGEAWGHHACGTCKIGKAEDRMAVIDSSFRVHGVGGLRVVDASVFPTIPGYFIATSVFMVAEKAADDMLADSREYPIKFEQEEAAAVHVRRGASRIIETSDKSPPTRLPDDTVGLALSGGGIRSATFCLGALQALAATRMLRHVDFVSTVSGGGYAGGFLGRLYTRDAGENAPPRVEAVEKILTAPQSPELRWLRRHADYLSGAGRVDLQSNLAIFARNLVAVHLCIGALFLALFGCLRLVADTSLAAHIPAWSLWGQAVSPWWWVPVAVLLVAVIPLGIGYWLSPNAAAEESYPLFPVLLWIALPGIAILANLTGHAPSLALGDIVISRWWWVLVAFVFAAVAHLIIGMWRTPSNGAYPVFPVALWIALLACGVAALGVSGLAGWGVVGIMVLLLGWLAQEAARWGAGGELSAAEPGTVANNAALAGAGAVIRSRLTRWLGIWILAFAASVFGVVLDTLARWSLELKYMVPAMGGTVLTLAPLVPVLRGVVIRFFQLRPGEAPAVREQRVRKVLVSGLAFTLAILLLFYLDVLAHAVIKSNRQIGVWMVITAIVGSVIVGRAYVFLNLSSLQQSFAQKLIRTFLGASTTARVHPSGSDAPVAVEIPDADDDLPFDEYHPEQSGGPLHLVNVCVNETVDKLSGRQLREDNGLSMCVGPSGVSVGRRHHALWEPGEDLQQAKVINTRALHVAPDPSAFHVLARSDQSLAAVERLPLGQWLSISGAALSTGAGRYTSLSQSLLLGLFNVRLGYWWDSGIDQGKRPSLYPPSLWRKIKSLQAIIFRVQASLLNEWRGYFEGPSARRWYLSDGGHFDNTGLYELVRRRLPFIIAIDGSRDERYEFEDLAVLVRQVRMDFGADFTWLDPTLSRKAGQSGWSALDSVSPAVRVPDPIRKFIAPDAVGSLAQIRRDGRYCAALARIHYAGDSKRDSADDSRRESWLLLLKAGLAPDLPVDIRNYASTHADFPQESTTDQFFDNSQWESYRGLGQAIGKAVFLPQ